MGSARLPVAFALCAALLAAPGGCRKDRGVIGSVAQQALAGATAPEAEPGCDPQCAEDEQCDEGSGVCVPLADAGACVGAACAQCDDDEQCGEDAPVCDEGRCVECEENSDCDGSGDLECQDGRCVEADEEEASPGDDELPFDP